MTEPDPTHPAPASPGQLPAERRLFVAPRLRDLAGAALVLAGAAAICHFAGKALPEVAGALLFLMAVLICAARYGFWVGIAAATLAFALQDFFFVEPHFTFHIRHPQDLIGLLVFMVAAGLTGWLAGRLREQVDAAEGRAQMLEVLARLSRGLSAAATPDAVLAQATQELAAVSAGPALALRREPTGGLSLAHSVPPGLRPGIADLQAADTALRRGRAEMAAATGWAEGGEGTRYSFAPTGAEAGTTTADTVLGYIMINPARRDLIWREEAISAILHQSSLALDRLALARNANEAARQAEAEALRASVLSSLSHDLRTPLASILGAATTLTEFRDTLPEAASRDLLATITEEAGRLRRYVDQLLQMTRLQAGVPAQLSWVDAADVAARAAARAARAFPQAGIRTELAELPMIRAEAGLLEQALFNLLENAARYAPGQVVLRATTDGSSLALAVTDSGPGLPPALRDWLNGDSLKAPGGSRGLGLPIAAGIARMLGGRLRATDTDIGSCLTLTLPLPLPAADTR